MIQLGREGLVSNLRFTGIKRVDGTTVVPKGNDVINEGDEVFAIGSQKAIAVLLERSGVSLDERLHRVVIAGAGRIGIYLAQTLEQDGVNVKLIEVDREKAEIASRTLKRTTVLHGDYLKPGFLEEAGVFRKSTGSFPSLAMTRMTSWPV